MDKQVNLTDEDSVRPSNHYIKVRYIVNILEQYIKIIDEFSKFHWTFSKQEIILHPRYKLFEKKNDIALLKLGQRIYFSETIRPACLQTDARDEDSSVDLIVTGWGNTCYSGIERKKSCEIIIKHCN